MGCVVFTKFDWSDFSRKPIGHVPQSLMNTNKDMKLEEETDS